MAVDVYSDHFVGMNSPSFSFSNDLQQPNTLRFDHSLIDSSFDFAFNVDTNISFQSSTADELFSNGKILPTTGVVKKEQVVTKIKHDEILSIPSCSEFQSDHTRFDPTKKSLKEFLLEDGSEEEEPNTVAVTKPFWKFRRSNSLNYCDRNHKKGLIGSWKILSRSGSTGKFLEKFNRSNSLSSNNNNNYSNNNAHHGNVVVNNKDVNISSEVLRRSNSTSDNYYLTKSDTKSFRRSYSTGSALLDHGRNKKLQQQQRQRQQRQRQQKRNGNGNEFGGYYSKNVKINPVLNLPSPYICRVSVDLFGIGSLFCNGSVKDRKKRK